MIGYICDKLFAKKRITADEASSWRQSTTAPANWSFGEWRDNPNAADDWPEEIADMEIRAGYIWAIHREKVVGAPFHFVISDKPRPYNLRGSFERIEAQGEIGGLGFVGRHTGAPVYSRLIHVLPGLDGDMGDCDFIERALAMGRPVRINATASHQPEALDEKCKFWGFDHTVRCPFIYPPQVRFLDNM